MGIISPWKAKHGLSLRSAGIGKLKLVHFSVVILYLKSHSCYFFGSILFTKISNILCLVSSDTVNLLYMSRWSGRLGCKF